MKIYEFINLIKNAFASQIKPDPVTHKITALLIYQDVITWFTDMSLIDNEILNNITKKSNDYCEKLLNENNNIDMPIKDARYLKSKITWENFQDIFDNAGLTEEAISLLIQSFAQKGIILTGNDLPKELADVFANLLQERSEKNKKISIKKSIHISLNKIRIGGTEYTLHPALQVPDNLTYNENIYVSELLSVYSQKTGSNISSIEDLNDYQIYQNELQNHREAFYSAETVLMQVRNFFYDGELEFIIMKDEIYKSIRFNTNFNFKDGYEKLTYTINNVMQISFSKSYFSSSGNGWVGNEEKIGMVHMLVNERKVKWIV
jgi:hypothetical protein